MFMILIAEDDFELRQLFKHVLSKNGYQVTGVSNGREALEAMDRDFYDLVISDIMMPEMDISDAFHMNRLWEHIEWFNIIDLVATFFK